MKKSIRVYFLVRKSASNDDDGVARSTVSWVISPKDNFKTGDFVEEKLGWLP